MESFVSNLVVVTTLPGPLSTLAYVPNYVTEEEEQRLLREVYASKVAWTQLSGRRLQNHGGVVHSKGLLQARMPSWLTGLLSKLHSDTGVYGDQPPNHVLVNAYKPGEGIMPHEDGPAYWPGVCILSLAAPAIIRFFPKQSEGAPSVDSPPVASVLLMPRSLLIFTGEAYTHCLHGIREVEAETLDNTVVNLCCHPELMAPQGTHGLKQPDHRHVQPQHSHAPAEQSPHRQAASASVCNGAAGKETGQECRQSDAAAHDQGCLLQQAGQGATAQGSAGMTLSCGPQSVSESEAGPGNVCTAQLPRGRERISLTVRRVTKVIKSVVRLSAS